MINNIEINSQLNKIGFTLFSEYINSNIPIIVTDNIGYKYKVFLHNILRLKSARKFDINNPYTIENIKLWLKINNSPLELISDVYKGNHKNLIFKDKDNFLFTSNINNIVIGQIPEKFSYSNPYVIYNIKLWLKLNNKKYNLLSEKYNRSFDKIDIIDEFGYKYSISWNNLYSNNGKLHKFYKTNPYTIDNIKLWLKLNNKPYELIEEQIYEGNNIYLDWKCLECGRKFKSIWNNIFRGSGCSDCNKSKGEKKIKDFFILNDIFYIPEKTFDNLRGLGNGLLSYDFYLPEYNLLIEYQGQFHKYKQYEHHDFERQKEHDLRKCKYAKENKYNFLEIWYEDYENIEKIIKNILKL